MNTKTKKHYYHFTNDKLRDGRKIPGVGVWLEHDGELDPCHSGLHASEHPFDALSFAPGYMLHKVELGDRIVKHGDPVDKVVSNQRKIIASIDAKKLCHAFARRCALDVVHLWDCPAIVKQYLETGDESLRDAAWAAARDAAWAAARDAAWAAARAAAWAAAWDAARDAAWAAARDAAWAAARDAAWAAARDAARDAASKKYRQWFQEMVDAEFAKTKQEAVCE